MEKYCETIVFCVDDYDNNHHKMFKEIARTMDMLTKNGYTCLFYADELSAGIYVIEFNYNHRQFDYGVPQPVWLTAEEICTIEDLRRYHNEHPDGEVYEIEDYWDLVEDDEDYD
jgi:hypothetical protein